MTDDKLIRYKERNHDDPFDYELNDVILRRDAMEALESDENLYGAMDSLWDGAFRRTKRAAVRVVASVTAVDAVPVVRCKDCNWATMIMGECASCARLGDLFQTDLKGNIKGEFYCAYGERRE